MTGPEHYLEAERLLDLAESTFLDPSDDPAPREEYASEAAYVEALQMSNDLHREAMRTATWATAQAQAHATLALAAATALIDETPRSDSHSEYRAWSNVAGSPYHQGPEASRG